MKFGKLIMETRVVIVCTSILTHKLILEFKFKESRQPTGRIGQEHNSRPKECTIKCESK